MTRAMFLAGLATVMLTGAAGAQDRWIASADGGYAASTGNTAGFPGGGSFTGPAFIGRTLGRLVTLGVEGSYAQVRDEHSVTTIDCFSTAPATATCTSDRRDKSRWISPSALLRFGPVTGTWRPVGLLSLGGYWGKGITDMDVVNNETGQSEPNFPSHSEITSFAFGASIGAGIDWAPGNGPWSFGVSSRFHWLEGGTNEGEFGGDRFFVVTGGIRYNW